MSYFFISISRGHWCSRIAGRAPGVSLRSLLRYTKWGNVCVGLPHREPPCIQSISARILFAVSWNAKQQASIPLRHCLLSGEMKCWVCWLWALSRNAILEDRQISSKSLLATYRLRCRLPFPGMKYRRGPPCWMSGSENLRTRKRH